MNTHMHTSDCKRMATLSRLHTQAHLCAHVLGQLLLSL